MVYPYNIQNSFKGEVERSMCIAIHGTKQTIKKNRASRLTLTAKPRRFFRLPISAPNLSFTQSSYHAVLRQVSSALGCHQHHDCRFRPLATTHAPVPKRLPRCSLREDGFSEHHNNQPNNRIPDPKHGGVLPSWSIKLLGSGDACRSASMGKRKWEK